MDRGYWDSDDFFIALGIGVIFVALVAAYIGLVLWRTPWLDELPFNPWWLVALAAAVSLILAVLTGWEELFGIILLILIGILAIPPVVATSPVWGFMWGLLHTISQRRKRRHERETRDKLERVLKQLGASGSEKGKAQQSFEEDLWPDLGALSEVELTEAFRQIAKTSPRWGLDQVHRALFWDRGDGQENVQNASLAVLQSRLAQPDEIFAELARLMSRTDWDIEQSVRVLGRMTQESEHDGLGDICRAYALLQAAQLLCAPPDYMSLSDALRYSDWTWADEWLPEIFPGLSEGTSASTALSEKFWEPEILWERGIPSVRDRVTAILNVATSVLENATELRYGEERCLTYRLLADLEQARFERDMIALIGHGNDLFTLPGEELLYPQLVTGLRDLIRVCSLVRRSERSGLQVTDRLAFYAAALGILQSILQAIESGIGPPEEWFVRRIVEHWLQIITDGIAKMRAKPKLEIKLAGVEAAGPDYTVSLVLHNRASGLAEQVRVQFDPDGLLEAKGICAQDATAELEFIRGDKSVQVGFRLSVDQPGTFRLPFRIEWNDLEREGKRKDFADEVSFVVKERSFRLLEPNPYIAGPPLKTGEMFFGREGIFRFVEQRLPAGAQQNLIVLHGERRTGKTSILYQLQHRLSEPFIPILVDLQGAAGMTADAFWHYIAVSIYNELEDRSFSIERPELTAFSKDPFYHLRDNFLGQVKKAAPDKRLVLLVDEFDILENEVKAGNLSKEAFGNLRHLMQHTPLSFLFAGTYDITKLGSDYWSVLFNINFWKRIELLDRVTCDALVQEPVKEYFEYDEYALDKIWEITSGHPFFVQLICNELVNYRNDYRLPYLTVQHVDDVIEEVVDVGQIHLGYMWDGLTLEKKQFLVIVSELLETKGIAVLADIRSALEDHGIHLDLEDALRELTAKAILEEKEGQYYFPIGLVRTWIYETKSLESLM